MISAHRSDFFLFEFNSDLDFFQELLTKRSSKRIPHSLLPEKLQGLAFHSSVPSRTLKTSPGQRLQADEDFLTFPKYRFFHLLLGSSPIQIVRLNRVQSYFLGQSKLRFYFFRFGFFEKRSFCFSTSIHQLKNPKPYLGVILGRENLFQ